MCVRMCPCRYRIGPHEVEVVLMSHPAVLDAAVVGSPDSLRGEVSNVVRLFVHFNPTNPIIPLIS